MSFRNRALCDRYNAFRHGCENAPEGMFTAGKQIMQMLSDMMDGMEAPAREARFKVSNCDRAFDIEASLFEMIYDENPLYQGEIDQLVGLGESLRHASPEEAGRILGGLIRDRNFVRSLEQNTDRLVRS